MSQTVIDSSEFSQIPETISPCICTLRRKLKSIGHADVIKTIRGTGYRLSPHYIARATLGTC